MKNIEFKLAELLSAKLKLLMYTFFFQIRNYFKPSQKDAFFDVEGVVNKDVLLFRYDDSGLVGRPTVRDDKKILMIISAGVQEEHVRADNASCVAPDGTVGVFPEVGSVCPGPSYLLDHLLG